MYLELPYLDAENERAEISFLIITATKAETNVLHKNLKPFPGHSKILKVYHKGQTYYLASFGCYAIVHVQSGMGSTSFNGSIITVTEAIESWQPKAVVMIGIAFGIDKNRQNIGDVLVSTAIVPYNIKRVGKKSEVYRSPIPPPGNILLNRFRNIPDWDYTLSNGRKANVIFCHMLSGESLIDNAKYRNKLIKAFRSVRGGEMEGAGLYAVAHNKKVEWIVIKGISDYADGSKSKNKEEYQKIAIKSATALCLHVFSNKTAFVELDFITITESPKPQLNTVSVGHEIMDNVLFSVYHQENENYYLEREEDTELQNCLKNHSVWISGPSGVGKTTCMCRNLTQCGKDFKIIDLSCCAGEDIKALFGNIGFELADIVGAKISIVDNDPAYLILNKIVRLLEKLGRKEIYLCFDEIPIRDPDDHQAFVTNIVALMNFYSNRNPLSNLKFVLSSIESPIFNIESFQKKVHERIRFIYQHYWSSERIKDFLQLINRALKLEFTTMEIDRLVSRSNVCRTPRFIKIFLRNYINWSSDPNWTIEGIIQQSIKWMRDYEN